MKLYRDRVATDLSHLGIEIEFGSEGVIAIYIRLSQAPVYETLEIEKSDLLCDIDCEGRPVGIEMINPGHVSFKKVLKEIYTRFKVKPKIEPQAMKKLEALLSV